MIRESRRWAYVVLQTQLGPGEVPAKTGNFKIQCIDSVHAVYSYRQCTFNVQLHTVYHVYCVVYIHFIYTTHSVQLCTGWMNVCPSCLMMNRTSTVGWLNVFQGGNIQCAHSAYTVCTQCIYRVHTVHSIQSFGGILLSEKNSDIWNVQRVDNKARTTQTVCCFETCHYWTY